MKLHESVVYAVRQKLEEANCGIRKAEVRISDLERQLAGEREQLAIASQWSGELKHFLECNSEKPISLVEWQQEQNPPPPLAD